MLIDKDRLEEIKDVVFRGQEDDNIDFVPLGQKAHYPSYYITPTRVLFFETSADDYTEMSENKFLKKVENTELSYAVFRGHVDGEEQYDFYETWEEMEDLLGISKMVVIATKVPAVVAKRFRAFASDHDQSVSSQLRRLTYDFVEKEFKDKAPDLMFRVDI